MVDEDFVFIRVTYPLIFEKRTSNKADKFSTYISIYILKIFSQEFFRVS